MPILAPCKIAAYIILKQERESQVLPIVARSPNSFKRLLHIAMDADLLAQIDAAAQEELLTRSEYVRRAVYLSLRPLAHHNAVCAPKQGIQLGMSNQELDDMVQTLQTYRWQRRLRRQEQFRKTRDHNSRSH